MVPTPPCFSPFCKQEQLLWLLVSLDDMAVENLGLLLLKEWFSVLGATFIS